MSTEQNEEKTKKQLLLKSGAGLSFLCLVLLTAVWVFATQTFGWFSQNNDVNAGGINLTPDGMDISAKFYVVDGSTETEIDSWDKVFQGMLPGDEITLKAVYNNLMFDDFLAVVYLAPYEDGEIPLTVQNGEVQNYYYFGSQLKITSVTAENSLSDVKGEVLSGGYLVENPNDDAFFTQEQTVENTVVGRELSLPSAKEVDGSVVAGNLTVSITVQFVNLPIDQNAYQGFGLGGTEKCYRFIVLDLYPDNSVV